MMTPNDAERESARQRHAALLAQAAAYANLRNAIIQEASELARRYGLEQQTRRRPRTDVWRGERREGE